MKIKRTQAISIAAVVLLIAVGYMLFSRNGGIETVIVGSDGLVRKEKYISNTDRCMTNNAPTWCPDEYSVAYSSGAANDSDNSFFNPETGMCSDGTKDCVYTERYNSGRILQGIFNSKGEELGQKFLDDLYAGRITFSSEMSTKFINNAKFENGILKFKEGDTWYTVKVGIVSNEKMRDEYNQGIMRVPVSMFLLVIGIYFKSNNLPKPTLRYQLHSPLNAVQFRASLPPDAPAPGPISRPEPPTATVPPSA